MAYVPASNPIVAYVQPNSSARIKQWIYVATTPSLSVATDGHFSDGYDRGVRVGDIIWNYVSGANELALRRVATATATGGISTELMIDPNAATSRTHREFTAAGTCTVDADADDIVEIKKAVAAATSVQLPLASARTSGRAITIIDGTGDAASNNITISPAGSDTIVGLSTYAIAFNYGAVSFLPNFDEDKWLVS
jgi:hypothetical protein